MVHWYGKIGPPLWQCAFTVLRLNNELNLCAAPAAVALPWRYYDEGPAIYHTYVPTLALHAMSCTSGIMEILKLNGLRIKNR